MVTVRTWYVYDRHANLLRVASSLAEAEEWAFAHWGVVEVGNREEVSDNDYFYLLYAEKTPAVDFSARDFQARDFQARDFQARITREDRVVALGRTRAPRHGG